MTIARERWLFVQSSPMTSADFIEAADERGVTLTIEGLRTLNRHRLLQPSFAVHDKPCGHPIVLPAGEPTPMSTMRMEFSAAQREGRLSDPFVSPLPRTWPFRGPGDPSRWWNGLLYSRWQVIELPLIVATLRAGRWRKTPSGRSLVLPRPDGWELDRAAGRRRLALLLTAFESRYAPKVDTDWIRLVNTDFDQWDSYRQAFDPQAAALRFGVTPADAESAAEGLLASAKNMDPLGSWHRLIRQADPKSWKELRGGARLSNDLRSAAELLFLFAEDLAGTPVAPPSGRWWTPKHDRLFGHGEPLDRTLDEFGLSPHPRVSLIVEGETEAQTVTRIRDHLDLPAKGEEVQVVNMRCISSEPAAEAAPERKQRVSRVRFLATHLVTPIIVEATPDYYVTLRPIAQVRLAADPEGEFANPAVFKARVLAAVQQNLVDQDAADVDPDSLDGLIEVETWDQEFEFAHFSDEELLTALSALDASLGGRSPDQVRHHLAGSRARGHNIRHVWESWPSKPGKPRLAEMLWPVLRRNIDLARHGLADAPPIVAAVYEAHQAAIQARRTHFVLPRKQSRN